MVPPIRLALAAALVVLALFAVPPPSASDTATAEPAPKLLADLGSSTHPVSTSNNLISSAYSTPGVTILQQCVRRRTACGSSVMVTKLPT